jgi:hypothetical protein
MVGIVPDFQTVVDSLFSARSRQTPFTPRSRCTLREGVYHLDYHDDHVYVVTIQQIPRVRLPIDPPVTVANIDGVAIQLVGVSYANHVEVVLDAEPGPERDAQLEGFWTAWQQWADRADIEQPGPSWPATALTQIVITIGDDAGTDYRFAWGEAGGMDTAYQNAMAFTPGPPPEARTLTITFAAPEQAPVTVEVPLPPRPHNRTR